MREKNIGKVEGKILVFGGVYSNLQALQALKNYASTNGFVASQIFCTGDIIAYCSQPAECLALIQQWGIHTIKGNVELNLLDDADDCGCNFSEGGRCDVLSKQWYPYAKAKMNADHLSYIAQMPELLRFEYQGHHAIMLHGTMDNISGYVFKSDNWAIKEAILKDAKVSLALAGHCGLPFYDSEDALHWVNAGVIGMPANDGRANTWFATLDSIDGKVKVQHHRLAYDHTKAADLMLANNLPAPYAETLVSGIWDNCEILPQTESNSQGKEIEC